MAKLQCDICGGQIEMQAGGGKGICANCGTAYTVERMRELYSGIKVSVTGSKEDVQQWKALLGTYLEAFDFTEAEKIVKKILEASPSDTQAQELYRNLKDWKHLDIRNNVLVKYNGAAEQVVIPHGVTAIGDKAFSGCNSIFSVMLPDSVTHIGNEAFGYCERIESIDIPGTVSQMGGGIFKGCKQLKTVTLGDGLKKLGDGMFAQCENLESLKLPQSLCEIGEECFRCSGIQSITIPEGVMIVEKNTFNQCQKLSDVTLPQSLTVIKDGAFEYCGALSSIEIPRNVVKIGEFAFGDCSKLQDITLHEGVREIGIYAFSGRPKNIRIPDSVFIKGYPCSGADPYSSIFLSSDDCSSMDLEYRHHLEKIQATPYRRRIVNGLCRYCGGELKGVFTKKCVNCGKEKDY